ncbi:OmpA family protein [Pedobacter punctiformis]|uniref:OmpA family protein n=1 Tax=Pedobacter punctiformis TaxID=3004097 RepID=A0ABT4L857_9SPHI|nr:OmpA family protein [Pedobacter sp. HCMS5-2]MCZ4244102.1 OmpA family protein [Pedobacter sp. HCMS5-2]
MKKTIRISITLALLFVQGQIVKAQYVLKEADAQYELFNYSKAVKLYTEAYQKKKSLHATERVAECYRLMQDYQQAESWFSLLTGMEGVGSDAFLKYADALKHNAKYSEAKIQYARYAALEKSINSSQLAMWQLSCDSAVKWMQNPKMITIKNEKTLNSEQSDWAAVKYNDGIVFTSDRADKKENSEKNVNRPFLKFDGSKLPDENVYGWTGNKYLRLYEQKQKDSLNLFPINAGTNYHIGAASFSVDGNEMFFTLTRIPDKIKKGKKEPGTINIEIYSSKRENGIWTKPVPFRYNKVNDYSVGDPFLTKDGQKLYFVSNMPGGKGGTDIYVSNKNEDGSWGDAKNLSDMNTPGNERSPMFDHANGFYFSSDGRIGMGGLDIFKTETSENEVFTTPQNMGYPLNSADDDFALVLDHKNEGYFASNRAGGLGSDDIYTFIEKQIMAFKLEGKVFDAKTNLPLENAIVSLSQSNGSTLKVQTDPAGHYQFNLNENADYAVEAGKTNYRSAIAEDLTTKGLLASSTLKRDLFLEPIIIGKAIKLENIYYDFDKSNIRADASVELDKLVLILKENPTIWIELGSHTDSRGNDQYNQWLSQKRANSAVQYIIDRGIDKSRITAKGYGESVLLNNCSNGIKCTEAAHQLNRRTEFKITKQ